MRITDTMVSRNLLYNINNSREAMNVYQNQQASGKRLNKVSDDPVDYTKIESFKNAIVNNDQYLEGINLAKGFLDVSITSLEQINEGVMTAKEIAIKASDLSQTQEDYDVFKDQIDDIIEDNIALSNSTFMGNSVFSGTKTDIENAFMYNGTTITYSGNDKKINRKIAENYYVDINISGRELLNTSMFQNLLDLKNALSSGETVKINESIDLLNTVSDNLTKLNSSLGSIKMQVENTENRINTANLNLKSYLSNLEDADMAEAITQYKSEETAYQSALYATSNAINLNILSFLR
ncbi:MAG: hypothetical protein JXQ65_07430 [Candidatus Marinimicrobia bacterium]|nr:hypothetical protein [Candidatus Neomarinimicrobiota bacterium]